MSKRGGLVPRQLPRVKRVHDRQAAEKEEEAARHDSDMSVDSYPMITWFSFLVISRGDSYS